MSGQVGELIVERLTNVYVFGSPNEHAIRIVRADPQAWVSLSLLREVQEQEMRDRVGIASFVDGVLTVVAVNGTYRYRVDESVRHEHLPDTVLAVRE